MSCRDRKRIADLEKQVAQMSRQHGSQQQFSMRPQPVHIELKHKWAVFWFLIVIIILWTLMGM